MNKTQALLVAIIVVVVILFVLYLKTLHATPSPAPTSPQPTFPQVLIQQVTSTNGGSVVFPVLSDNFVVTVEIPSQSGLVSISPSPSPSPIFVQAWFNTHNDTLIHNDSLVVFPAPVNINQTTPIIYSDVLAQQSIPFHGYAYLVVNVSGPCTIRMSFSI